MNYFLKKGKKKLSFNLADYKKGGEAKVFFDGNTVYKIFHDPKHMIPYSKILELQQVDLINVCVPEEVIIDSNNTDCGFTMTKVDGEPAFKLSTNTFKLNNNIKEETILELIDKIIKVLFLIHEKNCLVVDLNDLNIIVKNDWVTPYFIDINSWKTPNFPFDALNPHFRDWSIDLKNVSELSDWFSCAIMMFKLIVGVHPYKGDHPKYERNQTIDRMKDGVSIFNKDSLPAPGSKELSIIPTDYRKWFEDLFENGKRTEPPAKAGTISAVVKTVIITLSGKHFNLTLLKEYDNEVISYRSYMGDNITRTTKHLWINNIDFRVQPGVDVLFSNNLDPVFVKIQEGQIIMRPPKTDDITYPKLNCTSYLIVDNTLYIVHEGKLTSLNFAKVSGAPFIGVTNSWNVKTTSLQVFDTMLYETVMGVPYLIIPLPKVGKGGACVKKKVEELDGYKIIDAKHDDHIVCIIGFKDNIFHHITLRFNDKYDEYKIRISSDVILHEVNFVVLENGITVSMIDDEIEIFQKDLGHDKVNKVKDPSINPSMKLCKNGIEVRAFIDKKLFKLSTKGGK